MKKLIFLMSILGFVLISCTKEKTDYNLDIEKPIVENSGFQEVAVMTEGKFKIRLSAPNGRVSVGYNNLQLTVESSSTGEIVRPTEIIFLPIYEEEQSPLNSCPHLEKWTLKDSQGEDGYEGYVVFPRLTSSSTYVYLYFSFYENDILHTFKLPLEVQEQPNKNLGMTQFVGKDGNLYYLVLVGPQKPKVGENELVAGLYKYNKPAEGIHHTGFPNTAIFSYSIVNNYTLLLDPRMPDPSMGNHSSPNNKDLIQQPDGFYHGIVNYTMTGNWALNFILLDANGQVQRGTVVPNDFTPGREGARSELFIDILL